MHIKNIYNELEQIAKSLGISIKKDAGRFKNGYAIVNSTKTILINRTSPVELSAHSVAQALSHFELNEIFIKPTVREFIESEENTTLETNSFHIAIDEDEINKYKNEYKANRYRKQNKESSRRA